MNTVRAAAVRVMSPDTEVGVWKIRITILRWRHEHGARSMSPSFPPAGMTKVLS